MLFVARSRSGACRRECFRVRAAARRRAGGVGPDPSLGAEHGRSTTDSHRAGGHRSVTSLGDGLSAEW